MRRDIPEVLHPIAGYFDSTYIRGKTSRIRRGRGYTVRTTPPRYDPSLWNQFDAVRQGFARTNNISEGWHNRFKVVVGKHHPSLYAFLEEIKKEQADTEIMLRQI